MPQGEKEEQKDSKVQGRNSCRCWHSPSSPKAHSFAEMTVASSSHGGTSSPSRHAPHQPSPGKSRVFATGKEGTVVPPSKSPHVPRATRHSTALELTSPPDLGASPPFKVKEFGSLSAAESLVLSHNL